MRLSKFVIACGSVMTFVLFACSAPPTATNNSSHSPSTSAKNGATSKDGTEPGAGTSKGSGSSSGKGSGSSSSDGTGTDEPDEQGPGQQGQGQATGACAGETTSDDCWECCEDGVPAVAAAGKEISKKWQQCACEASRCGAACKNDFCQAADPDADAEDAACEACLDGDTIDDCDTVEDAAWEKLEADPAYAPVQVCAANSKCDAKPADEED